MLLTGAHNQGASSTDSHTSSWSSDADLCCWPLQRGGRFGNNSLECLFRWFLWFCGPGRAVQRWHPAVLCLSQLRQRLQPLPSARSIPREFTPASLRLISSATGCQCCLIQLQVGKSWIFSKGEKTLLSEYRRLDVVFFGEVGY